MCVCVCVSLSEREYYVVNVMCVQMDLQPNNDIYVLVICDTEYCFS